MSTSSTLAGLLGAGAAVTVALVFSRVRAVASKVPFLSVGEVSVPLSPEVAHRLLTPRPGDGTYRSAPAAESVDLAPLTSAGDIACADSALEPSPGHDFFLLRPPFFGWSRMPVVRIDVRAAAGALVLRTRYMPKDLPFFLAFAVAYALWRPSLAALARSPTNLLALAVLATMVVQTLRATGAARAVRDTAARELRRRADALHASMASGETPGNAPS